MFKLDDFQCVAASCSELNKPIELLYDGATVPRCSVCDAPMLKRPSMLRSKHVSWSLWQVR